VPHPQIPLHLRHAAPLGAFWCHDEGARKHSDDLETMRFIVSEIHTVVAGIDRDAPDSNTLAWAADEAATMHARLEIRPVRRPGRAAKPGSRNRDAVPEAAEPVQLLREVGRVRDRLGPDRVTVRAPRGNVGEQLVDAGGDLLVVGAGRRNRGAAMSAIRWVAAHASCPVVVVKTGPPGAGVFADHVVVGVDGSESARAALAFAFRYAADHDLPLAAVHTTSHASEGVARRPRSTSLITEVEPFAVRYPTVAVKRAISYGDPAAALQRAAAGARLLVVGDRGLRTGAHAALGSVSEALLGGPTGSIAVVHPGPSG